MAAIQTYSKPDALKQAKKSRQTGWPDAHIEAIGYNERYMIVTHKHNCSCNNCPMIRTDGFVS